MKNPILAIAIAGYCLIGFAFQSCATMITVAKSGGTYTAIQAGVSAANAGDTVRVQAGTYNEAVSFGKSGTAAGSITLLGEAGAIIDGTGKGGLGITISSRNYIKVIGMEVRNFTGSNTPIGISVDGSSSNLEIRNNTVHNIENDNGNAHGIAFYGTSSTPISNIIVDGNEVRNCKLGQSESMVLNGNVTTFTVSNNIVHDNDNIGIDFIGFEGNGPTGQDQARNGICFGNSVYNISSAANPTYGGDRSADGIYVDGGSDIIIERNTVDNCDIGVEVASEHQGKTTTNITVRSNFLSRSYQGNIMAGGYASNKGNAANITLVNNTLYHATDAEIILQFNCNGVTIANNICYANSGTAYLSNSGSNNTNVTADNNLYYGASTTSAGNWTDAHAKFANPQLQSPPSNMHLLSPSPARDAGATLTSDIAGTTDIDGQTRIMGTSIDIGADEYAASTRTIGASVFSAPENAFRYTIKSGILSVALGNSFSGVHPVCRLTDLSGRMVIFAQSSALSNGVVSIDCKRLSAGAYLLQVISDKTTVLRNIVLP